MNLYIMMSMRTEMKLQLYAFRLHINVFSIVMPIISIVVLVTRRVQLMEQELLTLPGNLSSFPTFRGVRVAHFRFVG
jgi:hypothetical protein